MARSTRPIEARTQPETAGVETARVARSGIGVRLPRVGGAFLALLALLPRSWRAVALPALAVVLGFTIVCATAYGSVPIPLGVSAQVLLNATHLFHFTASWPAADQIILLELRLPRVLAAALVGAALATSGALFQGLLRNPLADPLLLGTSSGAALGATIGFALPTALLTYWLGLWLVAILAFVGALLAVALVYALATSRSQTPVVSLLLAGVAVGALLTAGQTLLVIRNDRLGLHLPSLYLWLSGGIDVASWGQVVVTAALVALGVLVALLLAPAVDAFALGEEMALHLGLRVERYKLALVAVAALLVAAAVSLSGLVGFVGLVAPHLCRLALGPRNRLLIAASALAGAIFVVVADLFARLLVAPAELPLGVLTALIGAPLFLWLLRSAGSQYRW